MAEVKYDLKESLNRIYRALIGSPNPTDAVGTVTGEIYSIDEAASLIAELLEEKLSGFNLTFEDLVVSDELTAGDVFVTDDLDVTDNTTLGDGLWVDTGTFYARGSKVSIGGFSSNALFGNGSIVLGIGPASVRPTGTLSHLGGVLFAENGSLMWLGSSGTVSTLAGS
jgi:hypothetical protein